MFKRFLFHLGVKTLSDSEPTKITINEFRSMTVREKIERSDRTIETRDIDYFHYKSTDRSWVWAVTTILVIVTLTVYTGQLEVLFKFLLQ
jgi:hypothetical protein